MNGTSCPHRSGIAVYFADPPNPWLCGINENTNGSLRQYLLTSADLSGFSQANSVPLPGN